MKKNRPGQCIRVLCRPKSKHSLSEKLIRSTGSIGVRIYPVQRHVAIREVKIEKIAILNSEYSVNVKISKIASKIVNIKPEFADMKEIAKKTGLSIIEIKDLITAQLKMRYE